jgi:hypothetical protein
MVNSFLERGCRSFFIFFCGNLRYPCYPRSKLHLFGHRWLKPTAMNGLSLLPSALADGLEIKKAEWLIHF